MASVSEEDIKALEEQNEKLRTNIEKAAAKAAQNEADRERELRAAELTTENTRLEAQLAAAEQRAKVQTSRDATQGIMDNLGDSFEDAARRLENPNAVPVDTNAENPPKDTGQTEAVQDGKVQTSPDGVTTVVTNDDKKGGN